MAADLLYLDYQATTPTDESVLQIMTEVSRHYSGNPHSAEHAFGWEAQDIIEIARTQVQKMIGARKSSDIIFTSGATESNNIAIKGAMLANKDKQRKRILINPLEHKCALESAKRMQDFGYELEFLPMDSSGVVKLADIKSRIGDDVFMLILQAVNNEIGTIQPVNEAAKICFDYGVLLHCDAAQAPTRLAFDVKEQGIASASLSGHKLYGSKGVGALYLRSRPAFAVQPLFDGGGQERGLRSGTLPTPLLAGFGKACEIATQNLSADIKHAEGLRDLLLQELKTNGINFSINGDTQNRIASNLNINLPDIGSEDFFQRIRGIAVSAGSACSSGDKNFSHVLRAIGIEATDSTAHIRISTGRPTTPDNIKTAVQAIKLLCVRS